MRLSDHRRVRHHVVVGAAAVLLLTACTGGSDDAAPEKDTPSSAASATPTMSPAEKAVAPLVDREAVDLARLPLPRPVGGNPAAWDTSATAVRLMAVASQKKSLWSAKPGPGVISEVAAAAPPQIEKSMNGLDLGGERAASLFWAPTFADDARPAAAKVVDARWTSTISTDGNFLPIVVLQATTLYTFADATPVVVQRQFSLGNQRPVPDLGAFRWSVDVETAGADACRMWTDGVIAPTEDADLDQLQTLVDNVVDQKRIDTNFDEKDDAATQRKKECS